MEQVVEQAASATPIETRVALDGVGYTQAEFESNLDADVAAAIWEAAEVDAAPIPILTSPRFEPGSVVRVDPRHAEGILAAKVLDFADEGHYFERLTWFGLLNFSSPYLDIFLFSNY